ncbi:MAG: M20 family metallopeptidase [Clostridiaceae bacterium]
MDFLKEANMLKQEIIDLRREFHKNPELGFNVENTKRRVIEYLEKENIEYKEFSKNAVVGYIRGNGEKTVALRADMDALPIEEKNEKEYKSKINGCMHACGHDGHLAILLGAAKILNKAKEDLKGTVVLLFEPAEETTGGARVMIEDGVLSNPKVDAIFGLHVDENISVNKIGIKNGVVNAASNPFTIKIIGKGGHGARPQNTIDPIYIGSLLITSIQSLISRELSAAEAGVLSIGTFNSGTAQNIIPETAEISGIIRTMSSETREYVKKRLKEITQGIVDSFRGKCEIIIEESYPCLYNDDKTLDFVYKNGNNILGEKNVILLKNPSMGVESFAYFSNERPSAFYFLGCRNENKGIVHPAHSSYFDIDEDCLAIGAAMQSSIAFDFLNKN